MVRLRFSNSYERQFSTLLGATYRGQSISFVETWRTAGIQGKLELQKALFPAGLVWGHEMGFLNHKNEWLMEGLQQIFQGLADPKVAAQQFIVKFGVPNQPRLNPISPVFMTY